MACGCSKKRTYVVRTANGTVLGEHDTLVAATRMMRANPGSHYAIVKK